LIVNKSIKGKHAMYATSSFNLISYVYVNLTSINRMRVLKHGLNTIRLRIVGLT